MITTTKPHHQQMDTLKALAGDLRIYTKKDVDADWSYNLYKYVEVDCKQCGKCSTGKYMRVMVVDVVGSTYILCNECRDHEESQVKTYRSGYIVENPPPKTYRTGYLVVRDRRTKNVS